MKHGLFILLLGILLGVAACDVVYHARTTSRRAMLRVSAPELQWLKNEFQLTDAEFARISKLHQAYLFECQKRCVVIAAQNEQLQRLLSTNTTVTPQIEGLLAERARTRADCETAMLKHFLEVSRAMPPAQGERYLAWVEDQTFAGGSDGMEKHHHP